MSFKFTVTGRLLGINVSKDGRVAYLKVETVSTGPAVDLSREEVLAPLDITCPRDGLPELSIGNRLEITGVGCLADRAWLNPATNREKRITNPRFQALSVNRLP